MRHSSQDPPSHALVLGGKPQTPPPENENFAHGNSAPDGDSDQASASELGLGASASTTGRTLRNETIDDERSAGNMIVRDEVVEEEEQIQSNEQEDDTGTTTEQKGEPSKKNTVTFEEEAISDAESGEFHGFTNQECRDAFDITRELIWIACPPPPKPPSARNVTSAELKRLTPEKISQERRADTSRIVTEHQKEARDKALREKRQIE